MESDPDLGKVLRLKMAMPLDAQRGNDVYFHLLFSSLFSLVSVIFDLTPSSLFHLFTLKSTSESCWCHLLSPQKHSLTPLLVEVAVCASELW